MPQAALTIDQLVALTGLLSAGFVWLINIWIIKPLTKSMDGLSDEIKEFKDSSHIEHLDFIKHFEIIDDELDHQRDQIIANTKDIENLKEGKFK